MFFPDRLRSIQPGDRVLEIGPGGKPFWRSDVFLEKIFNDESEAAEQRGYAPPLSTDKQIVYYEGENFPFDDNAFDYVICSHVLEHINENSLEKFVSELTRVAKRGYLEFPTVYYDYIYNIPKHVSLLFFNQQENTIYYLPKSAANLDHVSNVQKFFFETTFKGYISLIDDLKHFMFQGFEWDAKVEVKKADSLNQLTYDLGKIEIPPLKQRKTIMNIIRQSLFWRLLRKLKNYCTRIAL